MSEYMEYLLEKEKIDNLFDQGFHIAHVIENLNGALVQFKRENPSEKGENEVRELPIKMAESRKYFATQLLMRAIV
ncbi:hypothetical protein ACNRWW_02875 [Metabacillus sp. HB246100]